MQKSYLFIDKEEIEKTGEIVEELYGNLTLVRMFCCENKEYGDFYKVMPLIKRTEKIADRVCAWFTDMRY